MKRNFLEQIRRCAGIALIAMAATGCARIDAMRDPYEPPVPVMPELAPATSGAIYRQGGATRLFEDLRAGHVGDILTVRLLESTNASLQSNTRTSKSTETELTTPTFLGRPVTRDGIAIFDGSLAGEQGFEGAGSSNQSNSLQGNVTVTVVERYPNGNLRIRGEKRVLLNQGNEYIRLSGIIRAYDIEPDNSIPSAKVADAHISYSSKGVLAAANKMGPFSRFFHSVLTPF
ncbi:flagellar basal body L-ring protein FlgH [Woeseia oceani]|uniref:Flagellar L-ring protein n=1 Tax=Woeseia oceani TaxID=1548547 RepID=A0A193LEY7_9GAMM|nr:flagellar basal body L-ring protein FlgH [Woeseia oceani]ANO51033.1 flagellar basal body L-ring protein [Woeseia oceani]